MQTVSTQSWVALVDGNNFFVSCERAFSPRLHGRPVAVLSNNDGCVIARSDELKALGVAMGTPVHKIRHLVRRHHVQLLSGNFALYADMSRRLNDLLSEYSPDVRAYSIDESFIRLTGFFADGLLEQARQIEAAAARDLHLPVSIGIAPTPTLAKLANLCAKQKTAQRFVLLDADSDATRQLLQATPVSHVWNVGKALTQRLASLGIINAWQLREAPEALVRQRFSAALVKTRLELKGISTQPAVKVDTPPKQLQVSRSFGRASGQLRDLTEALRSHVQQAAERLRQQRCQARSMSVFLCTNAYRSDKPQHSNTLVCTFDQPTSDTREMMEAAQKLLRRLWRPGYEYSKAGVLLLELTSGLQQPNLFETPELRQQRVRNAQLMQVIDQLNQQQGRGSVQWGLARKEANWKSRQAYPSQAYTTDWRALPRVIAR